MLDCTITETGDIEPVVYEWGAVKRVAKPDLVPGCEQSFGLVHILPGKVNPEHWHDVIGPPSLAAVAMEQARVAVCHAFGFAFKTETDRF
jgi:hypothetical protein